MMLPIVLAGAILSLSVAGPAEAKRLRFSAPKATAQPAKPPADAIATTPRAQPAAPPPAASQPAPAGSSVMPYALIGFGPGRALARGSAAPSPEQGQPAQAVIEPAAQPRPAAELIRASVATAAPAEPPGRQLQVLGQRAEDRTPLPGFVSLN